MIISDTHRYVFIQTPMTGSSAVAKELVENYEGRAILSKHAVYSTFLANANREQRNYFVFSGIRHPLDKMVSNYQKMINNHNDRFTQKLNADPRKAIFQIRDRVRYRRVKKGWNYEQFLQHSKVYDEVSSLDHHKLNYVMKFETLENDFEKVLSQLGIPLVRKLPKFNSTKQKKDFLEFYDSEITRKLAVKKMGPFLENSEYSFPDDWGNCSPSNWDRLQYKLWHILRIFTWRYVRRGIRGHQL
ncbi:MAG: sulfotransferase family 2 domain-containing protein [Bacteroidota bacterium]|nr:sulfotransferase family 2 domain-containing protein [Bacteroidota bacterium]